MLWQVNKYWKHVICSSHAEVSQSWESDTFVAHKFWFVLSQGKWHVPLGFRCTNQGLIQYWCFGVQRYELQPKNCLSDNSIYTSNCTIFRYRNVQLWLFSYMFRSLLDIFREVFVKKKIVVADYVIHMQLCS
jgi:hypothetical protein